LLRLVCDTAALRGRGLFWQMTQGSPALRANLGLNDGIPLGFNTRQPPEPRAEITAARAARTSRCARRSTRNQAGFSTTLPSCQTIRGSFMARCCARTFLAARRIARSARATNAGTFSDFDVCPFFFMSRLAFALFQYHAEKKLLAVLREASGCPKSSSVSLAEGSRRINE